MYCVSLMVIAKQKPTVDIQEIRKSKSKHITTQNHQFTKGVNKKERKEKGAIKQP